MPARFRSTFFGDLDVDVTFDAPVGKMTHFVIGGQADALVRPRSADALSLLLRRCHDSQVPFRVLGNGANLLVDDIGIDGIVVKLDHDCFKQTRYHTTDQGEALHAMSGADMATTLMETVRHGLDGLTAMTGIPASIGGAVRMNAGGKYGCISDTLDTITCLSTTGELITHTKQNIQFGYRESRIAEPIILSATFTLQHCDPIPIRDKVKEIFAWKKSCQPLADSSAGCAFKNPLLPDGTRMSAGKLIDNAGLKGLSVGGASISKQHANFIVTNANATARNVIDLMQTVRERVKEKTQIHLQNEVVTWSRDPEVIR
jgi:UDP-N-acetylmuramate dehydrogenase|tara:strand:+ start:4507 stop:5454 length:948 start_codon:yes stop_codon:yes gene_type:complete